MQSDIIDKIKLDTIEEAIEDIKNGKVIIVVDDEDRENEGDFICAAEKVTPEIINFMTKYGRGLICTPLTEQRAAELSLHSMVDRNTDIHNTAFTVSVDYKKKGCTTGISTYDRATGIKAITEDVTQADDFARPGHIFPLVAKNGGVLRRTGHTEAAVDLAILSGLAPAGVLVEILNEDGTMARLPELKVISETLDLKLISIKDLVAYRMNKERLVERQKTVPLTTPFGEFELISYKEKNSELSHLVIKKGTWTKDDNVLCRVHSSNDANEIMSFIIEGPEHGLYKTLKRISTEQNGVLLILRKDETENDFEKVVHLMESQVKNAEPINLFPKDLNSKHRELGIGAQIMNDLEIRKIKLLTNSASRKRVGLIGYGLEIVDYEKL